MGDEERFEPHYVACRGDLDIDKRVDILNQRLGVLKDLYDLLQNSLNVQHGNRLEWIIIILILVEVVLELLELVHDAWSGWRVDLKCDGLSADVALIIHVLPSTVHNTFYSVSAAREKE